MLITSAPVRLPKPPLRRGQRWAVQGKRDRHKPGRGQYNVRIACVQLQGYSFMQVTTRGTSAKTTFR